MKRTRSLLSLALALLLVFSLAGGVFAADYPPSGFADVADDAWYANAVNFAKASGLMNGVGDNRFDPNGKVTRAMVVTVLYRAAEEPDVSGKDCAFTDVTEDWYKNAVIWAADAGVTNGTSATTFEPNKPITREQMATMIIRFALAKEDSAAEMIALLDKMDPDGKIVLEILSKGVSSEMIQKLPADLVEAFPAVNDFKGFVDAASISAYARWNVLFSRLIGIMKGDPTGTFRPQDTLTRAECAQTFMNLSELASLITVQ